MTLAHTEIFLRNSACDLLSGCWMADLAIQSCADNPLTATYPEIIEQLQKRYGTAAFAQCTSDFPLAADQAGKTLEITITGKSTETLTFDAATVAQSLSEVYAQIKAFFQNVVVSIENGMLKITSTKYGPGNTITFGGNCDLVWGPVTDGSGWKISARYYQNAYRINIFPGNGQTLNHIEMDIPPCQYKMWCRVCHGENEETSMVIVKLKPCECNTVNLPLPKLKTCAAQIVHPLADKIVYDEFLEDDDARVKVLRGVLYAAGIGKQGFLDQLDIRMQEAVDKEDTALQDRIQNVMNLAALLPECN